MMHLIRPHRAWFVFRWPQLRVLGTSLGTWLTVLGTWLTVGCLVALSGCASVDLPKVDAASVAADAATRANREVVALPPRPAPFAIADAISGTVGVPKVAAPTPENLYDVVTVYWGTDRKIDGLKAQPSPRSTAEIETSAVDQNGAGKPIIKRISSPGTQRGHRLHLGRAHVTIPKIARDKGTIQRPLKIAFLDYSLYSETEDPRKHFTIGALDLMDADTFMDQSNSELAGSERFKDQAFVFVHGFNTTFDEAAYRTAQIAHDLEFDGVPYMYSWPSRGEETGYFYDRDSADRARGYFLKFLTMVAEKTKAKRIHIIAHSLGIRPLAEALQMSRLQGRTRNDLKIDQLILASPDMDQDVFKEVAATLTGSAKGTTLYAANNDWALMASRTLALGRPRAGDVTKDGPMIVAGIDSIDVSQAGPDRWLTYNHANYADSSHLLTDLRLLLRSGVRPPDRRFPVYVKRAVTGIGSYWQYVKN
ncbi:MAG: alpha/beta hydrolase [Pseudomonadota bacterium]